MKKEVSPLLFLFSRIICCALGGHEFILCNEGDGGLVLCCMRCLHKTGGWKHESH